MHRLKIFAVILLGLAFLACRYPASPAPAVPITTTPSLPPPTLAPRPTVPVTATPVALVPAFNTIIVVVLENKEYGAVAGNPQMPYFQSLVAANTLLTQHYAVTHPSLPNYLALISGDTFGIRSDCEDCFVNAPSLPDLIEASGRTWKTYQEDMPSPCFLGSRGDYAQKHNPFVYFNSVRQNAGRCSTDVVPLSNLNADLAAGVLPNFIFITPNLCNDAHDCPLATADDWLKEWLPRVIAPLDAAGKPYLLILTWDEGQGDHSCCGLPEQAGGRIATVLVSPQARSGFRDETPYSHYSILKTISVAWGLPLLGHAADADTPLIVASWQK